jgi:hypothetical protein
MLSNDLKYHFLQQSRSDEAEFDSLLVDCRATIQEHLKPATSRDPPTSFGRVQRIHRFLVPQPLVDDIQKRLALTKSLVLRNEKAHRIVMPFRRVIGAMW